MKAKATLFNLTVLTILSAGMLGCTSVTSVNNATNVDLAPNDTIKEDFAPKGRVFASLEPGNKWVYSVYCRHFHGYLTVHEHLQLTISITQKKHSDDDSRSQYFATIYRKGKIIYDYTHDDPNGKDYWGKDTTEEINNTNEYVFSDTAGSISMLYEKHHFDIPFFEQHIWSDPRWPVKTISLFNLCCSNVDIAYRSEYGMVYYTNVDSDMNTYAIYIKLLSYNDIDFDPHRLENYSWYKWQDQWSDYQYE